MDRDWVDDVEVVLACSAAFVIGAAGGLIAAGLVGLNVARRVVQR